MCCFGTTTPWSSTKCSGGYFQEKEITHFKPSHEVGPLTLSPDGNILATGGSDTTILLTNLDAHLGLRQPRSREQLWEDLKSNDPRSASVPFGLSPGSWAAVRFIQDRFAVAVDEARQQRVRRLIRDLDDDDFDVRKQAFDDLRGVGWAAEQELRLAQRRGPSVEAARKIADLLTRLATEHHRSARRAGRAAVARHPCP